MPYQMIKPPGDNPAFQEGDVNWIATSFGLVFIICAVVSGYATYSGIHLFLNEVGDVGFVTSGTAILLTIGVVAILSTSWALISRWGPEMPTVSLKLSMIALGLALFAITLCVSSLSNLMSLAGPASKVYDWRQTHAAQVDYLNALENRVRGIATIRPSWVAERDKACALAGRELEGGTISGAGRGTGPVAAALSGVCEQTASFVASIDQAEANIGQNVANARQALNAMQAVIRNRKAAVIDREGQFLLAGDVLNSALQDLRSADLLDALQAASQQVERSVAELSSTSTFSARQIETVGGIREGLSGLVESTKAISERLNAKPLPAFEAVSSPDYLEAIFKHSARFVPIFAAAIGLDAFLLWALLFQLVLKAGFRRSFARIPSLQDAK